VGEGMTIIDTPVATPRVWLGAPAPGGLALPAAQPTPEQLYAPRGLFFDDRTMVVADTGNHRVLLWHNVPLEEPRPADLVLGQPDFFSEGPQAGGRGPAGGMFLPTGVAICEGQLVVADAWNHRVLVWDGLPTRSDTPPAYALGQQNLHEIEPNGGGEPSATSFYWPFGLSWIAGRLYVADTGNRRVLAWNGLPEPGQPPELVLGQPSASVREENRGGPPEANSFRWPHALAGDADTLYAADAGNHRILGWSPAPTSDCPAALLLGQRDYASAREQPHVAQGPERLRFPYGVSFEHGRLAVADTANNRVLLWNDAPRRGIGQPADVVLGQVDFAGSGENRWQAVAPDTFCWPYGLHLHNGYLAIADSGNNRVMIWQL
jgi:hypothetical protein